VKVSSWEFYLKDVYMHFHGINGKDLAFPRCFLKLDSSGITIIEQKVEKKIFKKRPNIENDDTITKKKKRIMTIPPQIC
jgi:hypothetical protein